MTKRPCAGRMGDVRCAVVRWPWKRILQAFLGVAALLLFVRWIRVRDSLVMLRGMNPLLFGLTCLLGVAGTALRGGRFYALSRALDAPVTLVQSVVANYAASLLAIVTPARAGEGGKVLFFDGPWSAKKRLAAGFLLEKLADLGLLLLAGAYGTLVLGRYLTDPSSAGQTWVALLILAALLTLGVALLMNADRVLSRTGFQGRIARWIGAHPILRRPMNGVENPNLSQSREPESDETEPGSGGWLRTMVRQIPVRAWWAFGLYTVAIWLLGILAQVAGARALDLNVPILLMIQASALSAIAGTVSGTPSGIGASQWVFTTLLAGALGVDRAAIGALSILLLVAAYLTALAQGSVGLALYRGLSKTQRWSRLQSGSVWSDAESR